MGQEKPRESCKCVGALGSKVTRLLYAAVNSCTYVVIDPAAARFSIARCLVGVG